MNRILCAALALALMGCATTTPYETKECRPRGVCCGGYYGITCYRTLRDLKIGMAQEYWSLGSEEKITPDAITEEP